MITPSAIHNLRYDMYEFLHEPRLSQRPSVTVITRAGDRWTTKVGRNFARVLHCQPSGWVEVLPFASRQLSGFPGCQAEIFF